MRREGRDQRRVKRGLDGNIEHHARDSSKPGRTLRQQRIGGRDENAGAIRELRGIHFGVEFAERIRQRVGCASVAFQRFRRNLVQPQLRNGSCECARKSRPIDHRLEVGQRAGILEAMHDARGDGLGSEARCGGQTLWSRVQRRNNPARRFNVRR